MRIERLNILAAFQCFTPTFPKFEEIKWKSRLFTEMWISLQLHVCKFAKVESNNKWIYVPSKFLRYLRFFCAMLKAGFCLLAENPLALKLFFLSPFFIFSPTKSCSYMNVIWARLLTVSRREVDVIFRHYFQLFTPQNSLHHFLCCDMTNTN